QLVGGGAILALFFLQAPMGTEVGHFNSVTIESRGELETQGIGYLPDGTKVVVNGVSIQWGKFAHLDRAKRPVVPFLVTDVKAPGDASQAEASSPGTKKVLFGDANKPRAPFWPFFLLMLVHSLFYVPTISITNSIAFANLKDAQKEFGPVRLWGT